DRARGDRRKDRAVRILLAGGEGSSHHQKGGRDMHRTLILILAAASLFIPFASALYVEVPDYHSGIASAGVKDAINGRYGDVIFATDTGISVCTENGTWYSVNARNPGETPYGVLAPL